MLLGVTVTAEQLHAVQADLHALVGAELARECGLTGERQILLGAAAPRQVISRRPSSSMAMLAVMNATD